MKLLKKITIIALLFTLLISGIDFNKVNIFAGNKNDTKENIKIESLLENNKPVNIKKVTLDSSGNPKSSETVNLNRRSSIPTLSDGYYTLDYGDGWVLGRDAGVIGTMIAPHGVEAVFQKRGTQTFINSISINTSASFTKGFVNATIKAGYGNSWVNGNPYELYKTLSAPKDKDLFIKIVKVFSRIDVIRVKNGNVIDRAETYKYSTCLLKSLPFCTGEKVDQSQLYQKNTECILGNPPEDINQVIDQSGYYEGYANIKNKSEDYWSTKYYNANDTVGIYFMVPKSGMYEIKEAMYPKTVGVLERYMFAGAQKTLYEVNESDNSKIVPTLKSISSNICCYDKNQIYPGNSCLTAELQQGKKYLILFNEGKNDSNVLKMYDKYSYRVRFKCLS